jgi:hypothetical protein
MNAMSSAVSCVVGTSVIRFATWALHEPNTPVSQDRTSAGIGIGGATTKGQQCY